LASSQAVPLATFGCAQTPDWQTSLVHWFASGVHATPSARGVVVQPPRPSQTLVAWQSAGVQV
jgi:hypothetical protein